MIRLVEQAQDIVPTESHRTPRRSTLSFYKEFLPLARFRTKVRSLPPHDGGKEKIRHTKAWQTITVDGSNVDYDPQSKQFIVTPLRGGIGESIYFEDLPFSIKRAITASKQLSHISHD